ncbi:MAG: tyrosine-type recombinase/integrase [Clostridia bacterium]|jgi:integrase/recombinase XerC|nr:tyrosine-type recombinase/integrase [Clostridia bacterium]
MAKEQNYYSERNLKNLDKIDELLEQLPFFCEDYLRGIETRTSTLTRLNYVYDLRIFFDFLAKKKYRDKTVRDLTLEDLEQVTDTDIEIYLSYLSNYRYHEKRLSCDERAKARKLSSVRAMYKYFFNKGLIEVNNTSKVATPKIHEKEIIRLEGNEVSSLLDTAEYGSGLSRHASGYHDKTRIRDIAILTLFLGTGIRISELVGLNNESIDFSNNSFIVTRKGGNQAILYFSEEVGDALAAYLAQKEEDPRVAPDEHALFLSLQYRRITVRAVENLVKKYAKIVSPLKKITPHKLRSTYGTSLYRETGDIYIVADVLGHRDVNTTRKHYAAITEDHRKSVAEKVRLRKSDDD